MGQCTSRKAAGAFAASAAVSQKRPNKKMQKNQDFRSPEDHANKNIPLASDETRQLIPNNNKRHQTTKGVASSFGFKKRTIAPSIAANATAAKRLANVANAEKRDRNGNQDEDDTESLTNNVVPTGRTTPKLPPPKKEACANTKIARFGFRQSPTDRLNRVSGLNSAIRPSEFGSTSHNFNNKHSSTNRNVSSSSACRMVSPTGNGLVSPPDVNRLLSPTGENNLESQIGNSDNKIKRSVPKNGNIGNYVVTEKVMDNRVKFQTQQIQAAKFTLQSTQLPRPVSVRVIETKSAKTLANNNKRTACLQRNQNHEETSSKDGSLTEDSGLGSHSGYLGDNDMIPEIGQLEESPTFGVRRRPRPKPRHLELIATSRDRFDVRDTLNDSNDSIDSAPPPLPDLPSVFSSERKSFLPNTGLVRERTNQYQQNLQWDRGRKISATSSDGYSDDFGGEEEKTFRDKFRSEKSFLKSVSHKTFLKSSKLASTEKVGDNKPGISPPSSDEHEWIHGGEAMADEISISMSSSSDNRNSDSDTNSIPAQVAVMATVLQTMTVKPAAISQNLAIGEKPFSYVPIVASRQNLNINDADSRKGSLKSTATQDRKDENNVLLTFEDISFAAVASSITGSLDDEMLSPVESIISCSEAEELLRKKLSHSLSYSKDINEKLTPSSPDTPTNALNSLSISEEKNSLSLSEGKDDFLDDEIADQPGLFGEKTLTNGDIHCSLEKDVSENTVKDNTPKPRRKLSNLEGSPLHLRYRKNLQSRTGSLDTLSPCESIASDDLMMDYDVSQSSGLDDCDRHSTGFSFHNETAVCRQDLSDLRKASDWVVNSSKATKSTSSRSRLLSARSRTGTPNSIPDSPRSLDSRINNTRPIAPRPTATSSPIRSRLSSQINDYESDDSVRLDRANHTAIKHDIIGIKTMLLKLRRVLNEPQIDEDLLSRSETHNPFDNQILTNGLFNSICHNGDMDNTRSEENLNEAKIELAELRRQVLFLQGQLEDKDKTVQSLQDQMIQLLSQNYHANSAPASTVSSDVNRCNAATQTERIRPISAGPSLLNGSTSFDGGAVSLVSANESLPHRNHHSRIAQSYSLPSPKKLTSKLWRQPGEPPSPQRYCSSIPRRARSRNRIPN